MWRKYNKYILTAAHCVNGVAASNITINVGFSSQNNQGSNIQTYNARRIEIHPNYNASENDFDVAVIEIDGNFSFNNFVQPIELISNQTLFAESIGNQTRVSGWGWTVSGQRSLANQLQAVDVPIISNQEADNQLDISYSSHPELTQRMISTEANSINRQGACHGDSGGPLVFRQNGQNDIQIGVVSWGVPGCVGEKNSPSVYAKLSQLIDWIHSEIWNFVPIQGSDLVCFNSQKTFTIQKPSNFPNSLTVSSWTLSNNIQIVSSNNSTAEITALNSSSSGNGWIRAVLSNGIILQEDFSVGIPSSKNLKIISSGNGNYLFHRKWVELIANGADEVEWKVLGANSLIRKTADSNVIYISIADEDI